MQRRISIIGAPSDAGANWPGTAQGPDALRAAGLLSALQRQGQDALDRGNLTGPPTPWLPAVNGYRHLDEVTAWCRTVHDAVHAELAAGCLPLLLGGDHSLAIGSISAVARHCRAAGKKLCVLWLDAHADCNTRATSPSGNLHGMPVACLCGRGPAALTGLSGQVPAVAPAWLRLIGARSVDVGEQSLLRELALDVFDLPRLRAMGLREAMARALAPWDADTHLHLSFDVDFLPPELAPAVSAPVLGGPSREEVRLCLDTIARTGLLASLDVVELNPARDAQQATATMTVALIASLFGSGR